MRVLVVTIVHRPDDARILQRQIAMLVAEGHEVTYAAPFSAYGVARPEGIDTIDLPRAVDRQRWTAIRIARRMLRLRAASYDVVLLHDPELLIAARGLVHPAVVWDVHEDTAAALAMKSWIPGFLKAPAAAVIRRVEHSAERRYGLLLAEDAYASRFSGSHAVVPNTTPVAPKVATSMPGRAVYVGHLTEQRGALDLIEVGRRVHAEVAVDVVGHAHPSIEGPLRDAHAAGWIRWHGFLPNVEALAVIDGATAGLSLLRDQANYRVSLPTKVIEYMAHGVPVVTTPLPLAATLVHEARCGVVVPFDDPAAAADAVLALHRDDAGRASMAARGHAAALRDWNWDVDGRDFVAELERLASVSD